MKKRILGVAALAMSLSGLFAASAAPPASAAVCVTATVTVFGNQVVPTTRVCPIP